MVTTRDGIIAALSILLVASGAVIYQDGLSPFTDNELQFMWICPPTGQYGIFYGNISGTGLTGYPHSEDRKSPTSCINPVNGVKEKWVYCDDYMNQTRGLTCKQFWNAKPESNTTDYRVVYRVALAQTDGSTVYTSCIPETDLAMLREKLKQ